jgi:hypothetical protein
MDKHIRVFIFILLVKGQVQYRSYVFMAKIKFWQI